MKVRTFLGVVAAVAFWGASFVATKVALRELSPLTVVVVRFALGIAVVGVTLGWRRQIVWPRRVDVAWLALLGLCGITVHQLLQANGLVTTTATNSGWIIALIPVFTALLARLVVGERFDAHKIAGLGIASAGAIIIIARGDFSSRLPRQVAAGDLLMLISAANWALFTAASKRILDRYQPAVLIGYVMVFGWLLLLPLAVLEGRWWDVGRLSASGWGSIVFLGVGCSGLAYILWYDALAQTEASVLAAFLYLEPLVTVIVAATVISERVTWPVVVGGAMILAGVWLVNQRRPTESEATEPPPGLKPSATRRPEPGAGSLPETFLRDRG